MVAIAFPVPCEVAFDYLADPARRPEWQSSLARVEDVDGEPRVGQTWVDVTRPGLRPLALLAVRSDLRHAAATLTA